MPCDSSNDRCKLDVLSGDSGTHDGISGVEDDEDKDKDASGPDSTEDTDPSAALGTADMLLLAGGLTLTRGTVRGAEIAGSGNLTEVVEDVAHDLVSPSPCDSALFRAASSSTRAQRLCRSRSNSAHI
mmetsp:Transcript_14503/g.38797  ORF Transcript_14503/g.38797 Transcript_14503/m.38797 type:complete len:128 (+) Transcript_14503:2443-2826(+)